MLKKTIIALILASAFIAPASAQDEKTKFYISGNVTAEDGTVKNTLPSDTLRPIVPNLTVNQNVSGQLVWNPIHTPDLPSSAARYDVDRRFSGAVPNWTNGLATPNLGDEFFNDNILGKFFTKDLDI